MNPMTVTAASGSVEEVPFMAVVNAEQGKAQFTVSGSANNNAVQVNGFASDKKPTIEEYVGGRWIPYDNSVKGYDGYAVHYNEDNTYGFSFIVDMGEQGAARTFRVVQE